ncbi:hypothetical protein [Nocardioides sp. SR21]|uniref:hypothetical protein n=1 Tax=Nocardioides sp. SR21 TaxID=2919501 RepID=UPI001FAB2EE3|nr:hypothetical protein [Nocardioides sp. SR21]
MRTARTAAALLLVGVTAGAGVVIAAQPGAAAAAPTGGCWTYVPEPYADVSTGLEPWTVEDGQILMGTTGATTTGGTREVVIGLSSGPVVSDLPAVGTASFLIEVDGAPVETPLTTEYAAEAGEPVRDVVVRGEIPVGAAGDHVVRLASVTFDVPAEGVAVTCNGQTEGVPGGANPATEPLPTDVTAPFTVVGGSAAEVTRVVGQKVTTAARAGNEVVVDVTGFPSSAPSVARLCDEDACGRDVRVWIGQDGTGRAELSVPDDLAAGDGRVEVTDGATSASAEITLLGEPALAAAEEPGTDTTSVDVTGTSFDPEKKVTVRGYDADGEPTSDQAVTATPDGAGGFTATFVVSDPATETITATQAGGVLSASYAFSGQIGTTPVDPVDPPVVVPPVVPPVEEPIEPPVDIPPPTDIPIDEVPGEEPPVVAPVDEEQLTVTEARLAGNATLAELFGGAVRRDLLFLVTNVGESTVENPVVRVSVGRSTDLEPEIVAAEVGVLDPGDEAVVTVPLELPMAAFGTYHVVGQVGDSETGSFDLEWTTYPWGLFALNALGAILIVWGVRRRLEAKRPAPYSPAIAATGDDSVVDLAAAANWWAYRDGTLPITGVPIAPPMEQVPLDAVVDLDAAEKWWARRAPDKPSQAS